VLLTAVALIAYGCAKANLEKAAKFGVGEAPGCPGPNWKSLGPAEIQGRYYGTVAGRINSIVLNKDGSIVVGAANGGLWRGSGPDITSLHWSATGDSLSSLSFGALDRLGATIYAASGEGNYFCSDCSPGDGIFVSYNHGADWHSLSTSPVSYTTSLRVSPKDSVTLWIAGAKDSYSQSTGVFVATDVANGNISWKSVPLGNDSDHPTDIAVDPRDPDHVLVADGKGIVARASRDAAWARVLALPADDAAEGREDLRYAGRIAISPSDPDVIYASFAYANYGTDYWRRGTLKGIFKSTQGGRPGTWVRLSNVPDYFAAAPGAPGQGTYDQALAVDPVDPQKIYAGGVRMTFSHDGGVSWFRGPDDLHPDEHVIAVDGKGLVYIGSDGGLFQLDSTTGKTAHLSSGLDITQFYQGGSVSADSAVLLAGSQDNGSEQISLLHPSKLSWRAVEEGDGSFTAINPTDRRQEYIEQPHGKMESTRDVDARSPQWTTLNVRPLASLFYMPFIVDAHDWNTIYAGADGIYKSSDGGTNWRDLTQNDPAWKKPPLVTSLAVGIAGKVIVAGRDDHTVAISSDGGGSWSVHDVGGDVRAVAISGDVAYAGARFQDDGYSRIFLITNLREQPEWRVIQGRAPLVNVIAEYNGALLIGTDSGVFQLHADGSVDGCPFGSGLPRVPVRDLLKTPNKALIALTHGRGAWVFGP
jgi:photosystem II stability/assembly factor-like uncharacterized protein